MNMAVYYVLFPLILLISWTVCFHPGNDIPTKPLSGSSDMDMYYDYIVVGAGPAGSVITRKLVDAGYEVLLLEAGKETQHDLGGSDRFGGPLTRFDIPFLWSAIPEFHEYHWDLPEGMIAKGLGGCGIHNAMLYIRALRIDFIKWNVSGKYFSHICWFILNLLLIPDSFLMLRLDVGCGISDLQGIRDICIYSN